MNFLKSVILFLLPSLAVSQTNGLSPMCLNFELTVTGLSFMWKNPVGGNNIKIGTNDGVGEGEIRWGVPHAPTNPENLQSGLRATEVGANLPAVLGINTEFPLGTLTHINYPINGGGAVSKLELCITVHTTEGDFEFTYDLEVDETTNALPCEHQSDIPCADQVLVINDPTPQTFQTMDGKEFEIDLLGFRESANAATTMEFTSQERDSTSAFLYGSLFLTGCPKDGSSMGDPHFQTWSGHWYDFHGSCDMHLVQAPNFAPNMALTIDIRTRIRYWYSYIASTAVMIGDDILEVGGYGHYFLNGISNAELPSTISGFDVTYSQPSPNVPEFEIALGGNEKIVIRCFKDIVSVKVKEAYKDRFVGSGGMMGEFHTGQVYSRTGKIILEDPELIAREWQVRDNEPNLFQIVQAPQYPESCVMPEKNEKTERRLGMGVVGLEEANTACVGVNADMKELCIKDIMATGDVEIASEFL